MPCPERFPRPIVGGFDGTAKAKKARFTRRRGTRSAAFPSQARGRRWCRGRRGWAASREPGRCARPAPRWPPGRRAGAGHAHGEVVLRDPLHRPDHLEHREAVAVAAIQHLALAAGAEIAQRGEMGADEVGHMDIVADARAVRRRIVRAEDLEIRPLAQRRLARDLDEMGGAARWTGRSGRADRRRRR